MKISGAAPPFYYISFAGDCLLSYAGLHQPHIPVPAPKCCWCFKCLWVFASLPLHFYAPSQLFSSGTTLFHQNRVPISYWRKTPLENGLLICSFVKDFNSTDCSFPTGTALLVSENRVISVSWDWNVNAKLASVPAVSPIPFVHSRFHLCSFCSALKTSFCISNYAIFSVICILWPVVIYVCSLIFSQHCSNLCVWWWFCIVDINLDKSVWPVSPMSKGKNWPLQSVTAQHWVMHTFYKNNAEIPHSFYRYFFRDEV